MSNLFISVAFRAWQEVLGPLIHIWVWLPLRAACKDTSHWIYLNSISISYKHTSLQGLRCCVGPICPCVYFRMDEVQRKATDKTCMRCVWFYCCKDVKVCLSDQHAHKLEGDMKSAIVLWPSAHRNKKKECIALYCMQFRNPRPQQNVLLQCPCLAAALHFRHSGMNVTRQFLQYCTVKDT